MGPKRRGLQARRPADSDGAPAPRGPGRAETFERRGGLIRLLAVADAERIAAAADRLAMTQPSLSRIGARLFERLPSGIRPTRVGARAVEHARRMLREIGDGEEAVAAAIAGRTGRFRVTASPLWIQAVVAPAVQAFHAAFLEVELKLRTAAWREGVRLLVDGRSDLHCGGVDTGEALPAHLRRERFLDVTDGIVDASGHPLHGAGPEPRDLAGWPWIDFDGPLGGEDGSNRLSLAAILDELRELTGRPARAVIRAGSAGLILLAAGPWLAWLPLDLLDRMPGAPIGPMPLAFGRRRYRAGLVARRSAEDHEPFRMLLNTVRETALGQRIDQLR